ncbi:MAG TPA: protein-glutamate O-methyltransferase CheR [Polyangia bacterium]|jgi:chemotaxis protein methyltransferase CheR|nr:protein-glutamate O-methyltransferase CheR [Polyangia bacterium]
MYELSDLEFSQFQRFIYDAAGITLASSKKPLVAGRLGKRVHDRNFEGFGAYFEFLASGAEPEEVQTAVDLLTTNETYFFREPKHFDLLRRVALEPRRGADPFRVWSAASSSGEEAYSIAMVLDDCLAGRPWEVVGSDISLRVLQRARRGHYPVERTTRIPQSYLRRYCLRGVGTQAGTLLVDQSVRKRVQFLQINLNTTLPPRLGRFDVIFLRNVMIYFNGDTKREVVARVLSTLKPGGYFLIGHSENLNGITDAVTPAAPSIYRRD